MLHACVRRFDVMGTVGKSLRTNLEQAAKSIELIKIGEFTLLHAK